MAGDSLERHWLCVSALAASAAGTPALFTALLDSGRIAPLSRHLATEDDCNELKDLLDMPIEKAVGPHAGNEALADNLKKESSRKSNVGAEADCKKLNKLGVPTESPNLCSDASEENVNEKPVESSQPKKKALTWLPALPSSASQSLFVCDLPGGPAPSPVNQGALDKSSPDSNQVSLDAASDKKGDVDGKVEGRSRRMEELVEYVDAVKAGLLKMKKAGSTSSHIAAFRSPPKLPFADTVLFFNDTLYVFQAKDNGENECQWFKSTLREELLKMGAPVENDEKSWMSKLIEDEEVTHKESTECLRLLKEAWSAATGRTITTDVFCFVTTHKHYTRDISALPSYCKFVTTDGCSFLKFDKKRKDTNSEVYHTVEATEVRSPVE